MGRVAKVELTFTAKNPVKIPQPLNTWGDHIKKHRLELHLTQEEAARKIGITYISLGCWERNDKQPLTIHIPGIIAFLGYIPSFVPSDTIGQRIRLYRMLNGLNKERLARFVHVDTSRVRKWEAETELPQGEQLKKIKELLNAFSLR
ncbi:MAG: helix-turn-helix domain-containing protein [Ignavibacteriae bacterium]|nr:helix-turn-helix domain-containing protein [Ignavibacteriota bacterium]